MIFRAARKGYVVLLTVLVVGTVASASAIAILLLGLSIERNAFALQISTQAFASTWSCAEHALLELKEDFNYLGNEEYSVTYAYSTVQQGYPAEIEYGATTCTIRPIAGDGNENRVLCAEAVFGNFTKRRLEIVINRVLPDIDIRSWEEVAEITLCDEYSPPACGDYSINSDEECDDGNTGSDDGCSSNCLVEYCGDGVTQNDATNTFEECDDEEETATCNSDCTAAGCGDGTLNVAAAEECDDGGVDVGDGCDNLCRDEICGNARVDSGEACDAGAEDGACDDDCTAVVCGDGNLNEMAFEECDGAGETGACDTDCTAAVCGDGDVNASAGESCDDAGQSASCDADCTVATCGDGTLNEDAGEECDDSNLINGDGCSASCEVVTCPSGTVDIGEDCDDSGESADCDSNCTDAVCGDSTLNVTAGEVCDEGAETAGCDGDCTSVSCGDGTVNEPDGETCDAAGESISCDSNCTAATCGDGTLNTTAGEACDDGNGSDGDGCSSGCEEEDNAPTDYELYWKFDESSGNPSDSSGNGYTGSVSGGADTSTTVPTLNFSNARSRNFDGSNDYISNSSDITSDDDVSVSFWTKNDVTPSQYDGIACKTNGSTWNRGWGFFYNSSSQIRFFIRDYSSNRAYATISPTSWNHVVGTYDGSTLRIYVNGVEGTSDSYSGSLQSDDRDLNVGRCGHNSLNIDGKVDDFRIYDRVLSQAEVTALANGN